MDESQRMEIAAQVRSARVSQGWSQATLAERASLAPNTVSAIETGKGAQPGSLGAVFSALGIEPLAEVARRVGLPADVHLVTEVVAMWLAALPESERPGAAYRLMRHITGTEDTDQ